MLFRISSLVVTISFMLLIAGCSAGRGNYYGYPQYFNKRVSHPISSPSMHRATLRPYTIDGKRYYPTVVNVGWQQNGIASWYGPNFHGKDTSNGERYNMYAMTAAHKTLPMNTMVRVTNKLNGKSVVVRVNDRGPFVSGRIIDLSYSAGKRIGIDRTGTAPVHLEVLGFDSLIASMAKRQGIAHKDHIVITNFDVQVGSFRRYTGAKIYANRYNNFEGRYHTAVKKFIVDEAPLYRVWLTGFKSEDEARDFIRAWNIPGAFIIRNEK